MKGGQASGGADAPSARPLAEALAGFQRIELPLLQRGDGGAPRIAMGTRSVGGYQGILFTRDPRMPQPTFDRRSITDDLPVTFTGTALDQEDELPEVPESPEVVDGQQLDWTGP